ncbi:hypothetical protein HYDPIDRAFT_29271 [Hydnomerulius pinastri MD-312]|uniref:Uncharacterized protein n=1 Tax=Hydnomerulius pinastri MD-312 TaxID=994086 RepID=A0A0C9WF55_9AGAM|nr:hypothetical protein HYDPIDRAFT_29271 [Hydnomerulius pinastri MD-312]
MAVACLSTHKHPPCTSHPQASPLNGGHFYPNPSSAEAVLRSPSIFPPISMPETASSELLTMWELYASTLARVTALEAELAGLRSTPQASATCTSPQVAPSPNPFTIAAGLVPAATQPNRTQPLHRARGKGTTRLSGPNQPTA